MLRKPTEAETRLGKGGRAKESTVVGWREWIALPDLGIPIIKVKVDTGARSSSLHAYDIEHVRERGRNYVTFKVHPLQKDSSRVVKCRALLHDVRSVRSSTGAAQERPVIRTRIAIDGSEHDIDLTLTPRDEMGFRMLLGREAIRGRFLVDPGRSFLLGRSKAVKKRRAAERARSGKGSRR